MLDGYQRPLYLLPFDHRDSYASGMFKASTPVTPDEHDKISDSKAVIYQGFVDALDEGVKLDYAGILVDEDYGAPLLRDAAARGAVTAVSIEKSGQKLFTFEYGEDFGKHIEAVRPTFGKVLVRYNPDDPEADRKAQIEPLVRLSKWLEEHRVLFMFELLVPGSDAQLAKVGNDKGRYDMELRPGLMFETMRAFQDAGVEPDVWKVEGLATEAQYQELVATARRGNRAGVSCIVLGRGASDEIVAGWLKTAAKVDGMIGFAVGRTVFWNPISEYESGKLDRASAAKQVADNYRRWVDIFDSGRQARAS
jgi:myo-inositol catabolism protein IolC